MMMSIWIDKDFYSKSLKKDTNIKDKFRNLIIQFDDAKSIYLLWQVIRPDV